MARKSLEAELQERFPDGEKFFVRLKPYDKQKGQLRRRYLDGLSHLLFREERGWVRDVPAKTARRLAIVRAQDGNEASPFCFDVATRDEAFEIDQEENLSRERRGRTGAAAATPPESTGRARPDGRLGASTARDAVREARAAEAAERRAKAAEAEPETSNDMTTADLRGTAPPGARVGVVSEKASARARPRR